VGVRGGWDDVLNGFDLSFVCLFTIGGVVGFVAIFGVRRQMWLIRLQWLLQRVKA